MIRISINKLSGKIIEMQSGGDKQQHLDTLINNAVSLGCSAKDVEVKFITEEEYNILIKPEVDLKQLNLSKKDTLINDNLPSWQQVSDSIDNATTLPQMKVIMKKMAKIIYWLAKNKEE